MAVFSLAINPSILMEDKFLSKIKEKRHIKVTMKMHSEWCLKIFIF